MKEIAGIATEEESFFKDRQTWNRCHVCKSKKKNIWKIWKKKTLTLTFLFFINVNERALLPENICTIQPIHHSNAAHMDKCCSSPRVFLHTVWHSVSYDLFTPLNCPFPAPLKKIFHLCFFSTHRLDQLQPYSESLSQLKQTVVCSTRDRKSVV